MAIDEKDAIAVTHVGSVCADSSVSGQLRNSLIQFIQIEIRLIHTPPPGGVSRIKRWMKFGVCPFA